MLPEAFTDRMQEMLSAEEYQAFLKILGDTDEVRTWLKDGETEINRRFRHPRS